MWFFLNWLIKDSWKCFLFLKHVLLDCWNKPEQIILYLRRKFRAAALVGSNQRFARKLAHVPHVHTGMGEAAFQSNKFWLLPKFKISPHHPCCGYLNSSPFHSQSSLWVCPFLQRTSCALSRCDATHFPPSAPSSFPFALSFSSAFNKTCNSLSPQSELQTHSCALMSCSHGKKYS